MARRTPAFGVQANEDGSLTFFFPSTENRDGVKRQTLHAGAVEYARSYFTDQLASPVALLDQPGEDPLAKAVDQVDDKIAELFELGLSANTVSNLATEQLALACGISSDREDTKRKALRGIVGDHMELYAARYDRVD
jgi:hypothetical protein